MIKVLQVLGSMQRGGAETFVMNVLRRADRSQFSFDFLVKERVAEGYEDEALSLGANIFCVESARQLGPVRYIEQQRRVMLSRGPYDIVHSHVNYLSGLTLLAAALARVPVRIAHSHSTSSPGGLAANLSAKLIGLVSTENLACSEEAGRHLFADRRFQIINNGVEWERFVGQSARRGGDGNAFFSIVQIGRLIEVKNQTFTLDVLKALQDEGSQKKYRCAFLGEGPLFDQLREKARALGLEHSARFVGSVANPEKYLKDAGAIVMPSLYEGIPLAAIEAQCTGNPVVLSDKISRNVDLGLGNCQFMPLEPTTWARAIKELSLNERPVVDNAQIMTAISSKGFSADTTAEFVLRTYMELLRRE